MLTADSLPPWTPTSEELAYEEERGKPMPSKNHAAIELNLGAEFLKHREFRPFAEFTIELIPGETKTPDLCVYPRAPLNLRQDELRATTASLLAVEIVSPSQGMQEIIEKVDFYHAHGVRSVWVVVPPLREVVIFLPDGSRQSYHDGSVRDPATGITADLEAVFA